MENTAKNITQSTILAVDDDRAMLMILEELLEQQGHKVITANNAEKATQILAHNTVDVILLDQEMPGTKGLDLVKTLKQQPPYAHLPIIMQTANDNKTEIQQGIDAGVFYYLTKPLQQDLLKSIVQTATEEAHKTRELEKDITKRHHSFNAIETCKFNIKTLDEAEDLAGFIANCYPQPKQAVKGIAALLINAVEHGNLGISYKEKTHLLHNKTWRSEVMRRQNMPEYADKNVEVIFQAKPEGYYLRITDQGNGFDWQQYLNIDPARATDNHGRGIAQANKLSFEKLQYNVQGNQVTAFISKSNNKLAWS